jgi:hypothetical protein
MILHVATAQIAAERKRFSGEILRIPLRLDTSTARTIKFWKTLGKYYVGGARPIENDLAGGRAQAPLNVYNRIIGWAPRNAGRTGEIIAATKHRTLLSEPAQRALGFGYRRRDDGAQYVTPSVKWCTAPKMPNA